MRENTIQAAAGRWSGILREIGIAPHFLRNVQGPCPICEGSTRFRFDDTDGSGSFYCNHCGAGYGMGLVCKYLDIKFAEAAALVDTILETGITKMESKPASDPRVRLRKLSESSHTFDPLEKNPVTRYLLSRGLLSSPITRYAPALDYWEEGPDKKMIKVGQFAAMLHPVYDRDGVAASFHITYLTSAGLKAPVKSPRKLVAHATPWLGGGVPLQDASDADHLGVAEGIETALAVHQKLASCPVWSTLSAIGMQNFEPSEHFEKLKKITFYADNDSGYTGQAAAYAAAERLSRKGYAVKVCVPPGPDTDWADIL